MTGIRAAFSVFALAACAMPAAAQETPDGFGLYGRVEGGAVFAKDLEQTIAIEDGFVFITPPPDARIVETNLGYTVGAALGFRYPSGFRTELEYRYATTPIDQIANFGPPLISTTPEPSDESVRAHFLMSNVYYDFKNNTPVTPYVGVGVGGARVAADDQFGADLAFAYQGRAGLSVEAVGGSHISVEYLYTRTRDLVFDRDNATGLVPQGEQYVSSSAIVSLRKDF
ncbi:MAG: outer membrane beta-barrel protein [Pseudomonadota bacterium]